MKQYTHNNKKVRGVLREPSHGRPIGTIKLTQKCAETLKKVQWRLATKENNHT